eukprot:TRINITY_DN47240_c0_g1_i1.p1 TRINITY_DN47240_c0_g1~~TRINITY_DN47240_c0_g1_i1.p1  ORF type:complete len:174 (-),score=26.18 TRINITY_DN47240_c0_g1_i1:14-514(-)
MAQHVQMDRAQYERQQQEIREKIAPFQTVYPVYMNSAKTQQEGRRLPKELCVENPTAVEIYQCAAKLGFQAALEPDKGYSRDPFTQRGRVRIRIKDHNTPYIKKSEFDTCNSKHVPVNEELPDKRAVMVRIASMIKELPSRTKPAPKPKEEEPERASKGKGRKGKR